MRTLLLACSLVLLHAHFFCSSGHHDDHDGNPVSDVAVTISGEAGTAFVAQFQDDLGTSEATGRVPYTADFDDQVGFFTAVVDKKADTQAIVCVEISVPGSTHRECTSEANGRLAVTLTF